LINQTGRDSYLASRVGELVITVKQSGNLRTSDLYSPQSFSSLNTSGTWGAHSPPTISTALAYSGASSQAGFDNDDVVEISFDKETNEPEPSTKTDIDSIFSFSASLGQNYTGTWLSAYTIRITVVDTTFSDAEELTRIGALTLTVKQSGNLKSQDSSSLPSNDSATVTGSWDAHAAPVIVSATAADGGSQIGLGINDTQSCLIKPRARLRCPRRSIWITS
jgi:hypothetical protein